MQGMAGTFFVIEGTDGSGKGTQLARLAERLASAGYDVATFDFPQYDVPSSYFVRQYLNGEYGANDEVGPYTASLFYALDRYEAAPRIREALAEGKIVLANRFVGSNMAHQGTKFYNPEERRGYFIWLDNLEFEMLRIPRPAMSFVLRVPADIAQGMVDEKEPRSYTDKKRDLHEADLEHLKRSVEVYDDLTQLFPKDFQRIDCVRDGRMLPIEAVESLIWEKVSPLLPEPAHQGRGDIQKATLPTREGESVQPKLDLPPVTETVQASKSVEPVEPAQPQASAIRSHSLTVAGVSQLVAAGFAGRARLSPPNYSEKTADGRYHYYMPAHFSTDLQATYREHMDRLFELYASMLPELTKHLIEEGKPASEVAAEAAHILQAVLPVAATVDVQVEAPKKLRRRLVIRLLGDELPEARRAGETILHESRAMDSTFLEGKGEPARSNAILAYRATTRHMVSRFAANNLTENHAGESSAVTLTDISPRNEFDLLADMLYENSNVPLDELRATVATWPYEKKLQAFETYMGERAEMRQRPGRALEKARYSWDVLTDFTTLCALQAYHKVDDREWQQLTPRHGYTVPQVIENAGLTDQFENCFDLSLRLYSLLQQAGHPREAQYATLQGHTVRWKLTYSAREAFLIHESATTETALPGVQKLVRELHNKLAEKHPLLGEAMKFVRSDLTQ